MALALNLYGTDLKLTDGIVVFSPRRFRGHLVIAHTSVSLTGSGICSITGSVKWSNLKRLSATTCSKDDLPGLGATAKKGR